MPNDPIRPNTTAMIERTSTAVMTPLGCLDVETPRGPVHFHDAPGSMTTMIERRMIDPSIGLLVYNPEAGHGLVCQFDAASARSVAASLLRLADELEPSRPH